MKPARVALVLFTVLHVAPRIARACCEPSLAVGGGAGGPVSSLSADTLLKRHSSIGFHLEHQSFASFSSMKLDDFAMAGEDAMSLDSQLSSTLTFATGLTDNLTLGIRASHVSRKGIQMSMMDDMMGMWMVMDHGDASGLGDTLVSLKWRFVQRGTTSSALIAGVEAPTGRTNVKTPDGEVMDADHQPGSGSWDALIGLALSHGWKRSSVHGSAMHFACGRGTQDVRLGPATYLSFAWVRRLGRDTGTAEGAPRPRAWDASVELLGENHGKMSGSDVNERGAGDLVLLSPGVRLTIHDKWFLSGAVGVPLVANPKGNDAEPEMRSSVAFGYAW